MAFRRGERGKCNEPVDDAGEHLVPHTILGMPRMEASLGGVE